LGLAAIMNSGWMDFELTVLINSVQLFSELLIKGFGTRVA